MSFVGTRLWGKTLDYSLRLMGGVFLMLGILKFLGLNFGTDHVVASYLGFPNPIFGFLTNWTVFAIAACAEIAVGWHALRGNGLRRASFLLWISSAAVLYKIGLIYVKYRGPCGCLFGINTILPLSTATQRSVSDVILITAFLLSAVTMVYCFLSARHQPVEKASG